ncbi:hypothetical protein ACN28S_54670 [Cystobacter fuscus]
MTELRLHSAVCVPLRGRRQSQGVMTLFTTGDRAGFTAEDRRSSRTWGAAPRSRWRTRGSTARRRMPSTCATTSWPWPRTSCARH